MTYTRTHTVFFSDDSLAELDAAIANLGDDLIRRRPHIDGDIAARIDHRVSLLRTARALLAEPVAE